MAEHEYLAECEYKAHLHKLALAAAVISDVPIGELQNFMIHAETLGPILAPSEWIRGGADNLREHNDLVRAAAPLVAFGQRLEKKIAEAEQAIADKLR